MGRTSHVADYIVIREPNASDIQPGENETSFRLREEEGRSFSFMLPEGSVRNERSIISFFVDPSNNADNLGYEVQINDHVIVSGRFNGGVSRVLWKTFAKDAFGREILREGNNNSIEFRLATGDEPGLVAPAQPVPEVKFRDVVLWFQRKVAEAPDEA